MINPDLIREGDQVTFSILGSLPIAGTVCSRSGSKLSVDTEHGDVKTVQLAGKRSNCIVLEHQPRLV